MDQKTHTSFIPKKSLATASRDKSRSISGTKSTIGIVFLITLIIFISVIALAIGVFLYQQFLLQNIEKKRESLDRARAAFEPSLIEEMGRLDVRMKSAREILDNHKALTAFFDLLETNTLASLQFENLSYRVDPANKVSITMGGIASSFSSVALQSDIFGENKFIQEPIFSNLNLDSKGDVIFDFSAFVDPRLLSYSDSILKNNRIGE
jgi:hypothetical protein